MAYNPTLNVTNKKRRSKTKDKNKLENLVLQLTLKGWSNPDIARHPEINLTVSKSGMSQRVWQIQKSLTTKGKLKRSATTGRLERPLAEIQKHKWNKISNSDAIENCKSLEKMWAFQMQKNQGKGSPQAKNWLNNILTICNTMNIHPDEIANAVDEDGNPDWLLKATEVMIAFRQKLDEDGIVRQTGTKANSKHFGDATNKQLAHFKNGMRQFLLSQGYAIPKLSDDHVLSGTKGKLFGAYNKVGMNDDLFFGEMIDFTKREAKDFGFVGAVALMPEMITRTRSLMNWVVSFETKYDEFEGESVEYDFVKGFHESKTEKKSKSDWDKFIIHPKVRDVLQEVGKERKGKTLVELSGTNKMKPSVEAELELNRICKEFYISKGILDETARLPRLVNRAPNPDRTFYSLGTEAYFYDNRGAYVLRHTGAHVWCRRTKYDYGFVSELGWGDMNTLKQCYAGMDLMNMLRGSMCMYCNPPRNPEKVHNHSFCSATHAFIYYSNGMKSKKQQSLSNISPDMRSISEVGTA